MKRINLEEALLMEEAFSERKVKQKIRKFSEHYSGKEQPTKEALKGKRYRKA